MAQQDRDSFLKQLQQTASDRAIPIDRLNCRDLSDKDGFELVVESGGKKRIFTISDSAAINDPAAEIELLMNQISDNE